MAASFDMVGSDKDSVRPRSCYGLRQIAAMTRRKNQGRSLAGDRPWGCARMPGRRHPHAGSCDLDLVGPDRPVRYFHDGLLDNLLHVVGRRPAVKDQAAVVQVDLEGPNATTDALQDLFQQRLELDLADARDF